ncbi:MAG: helix-turn-helix domain-containing protein [Acidimicrobiia bacterium]|nr:helix-turn-helix domain-containing protein [Acidimicrobiia bacterium]
MTKPADVFWLDSPEHFDVLSDTTRLEMIEQLLRPRTVRELAEQMRVPRTRLYHHVNLLEDAGMIQVVDTRRAGAQTEKVYQVAAYAYQPSPEYLESAGPREKAQAVLTSIFGTTEADFIRSVEEGSARLEDRASKRTMQIRRGLLLLDEARLHEFITELEAVYEKYDIDPEDLEDLPDDVRVVAAVSLVYPSARSIL